MLQQAFQKLTNHTANLTAVITKQEETINRLTRLRVEPEWQKLSFVPANVFTALGDDHVVINRGSRDYVQVKCFILANNGIVGKVSEIQKNQATVELISNLGAFLPVYINTRDTQGVCHGLGQGQMEIQSVRYNRSVEVGQPVYTSNQPGLLGTPIIVGKVASCVRDEKEPYLWKIEMAPAVDLKQLDRIDVVLPGRP